MLCCDNGKKTPKNQEVYILHQKGMALSILKDPIDSATVKLRIIHKTLHLKIPYVNKPKFAKHPKYIT